MSFQSTMRPRCRSRRRPPKWISNQLHIKENAMPVIINGIKKQILIRTGRGGAFDSAVKLLAPSIAKFQSAGCRDIRKLVKQLNGVGLTAPSGRPFSYGTLRRVLIRQADLHLGQRPRSVATAANQRASRPYRFRPAKPMRQSPSLLEEPNDSLRTHRTEA